MFLDSEGRKDDAEDMYLRAIEANFLHSNVHCVYADFLAYERKVRIFAVVKEEQILTKFQDYTMAERFYQTAIATDRSNKAALNNYAILKILFDQDLALAETLLQEACGTERGIDTPRRFLNMATFFSMFSANEIATQTHFRQYQNAHSSSLKMSSGRLDTFVEEPYSPDGSSGDQTGHSDPYFLFGRYHSDVGQAYAHVGYWDSPNPGSIDDSNAYR